MLQNFDRIIIPTDGSKIAKKTEKIALAVAKTSGLKLIVIHIVHVPNLGILYGRSEITSYESMRNFLIKKGHLFLKSVKKKGEKIGVNISAKLIEGNPAEEIIKESKKKDLVIIGSKGVTNLMNIFLGSVAEKVARHSPATVMIVR